MLWAVVLFFGPVLLRAGPLELRWSGLLLAAGLALGYVTACLAASRQGISWACARDIALWSLPEALLAARALHVLTHPEVYLVAPGRILQPWDGGFAFGGGLLIGTLAAWRYARRRGLPPGRLADAAVPGLLVAQALAALGRFVDSASQPPLAGLPRGAGHVSPQSVVPADNFVALAAEPRLVGELYAALYAFVLLGLYAALAGRLRPPGLAFLSYLGLQAIGVLVLGLWRGEAWGSPADVASGVGWAAVALAAALAILYLVSRSHCRADGTALPGG